MLTATLDSECARLQRLYDKMAVTLQAALQNGCNIAVYSAKLLIHGSTYLYLERKLGSVLVVGWKYSLRFKR